MGAFLFATKNANTAKVADVLKSRGHKTVSVDNFNGCTLVHAPKILVDNVNYLSSTDLGVDNKDFICGIGTFFYKNTYGKEALKHV